MRYFFVLISGLLAFALSNCADTTILGDCNATPAVNATLLASTPASVSHRFGEDCMQSGCHDGTAQKKWTVAGSVEDPKGSNTPAIAGDGVTAITSGNLSLVIDTCGNFYTSVDTTGLVFSSSSPKTKNFPAGMLTTSWGSVTNPGSCNQSGCHSKGGTQGLIY